MNIWLMPIVKPKARTVDAFSSRQESTTRTSWMANNAIPDSIIMNMTDRSLVLPVASEPSAGLTSKNTFRILNTIKVVTRAFTAMDKAKLVINNGSKGGDRKIGGTEGSNSASTPIDPSTHLSILVSFIAAPVPSSP